MIQHVLSGERSSGCEQGLIGGQANRDLSAQSAPTLSWRKIQTRLIKIGTWTRFCDTLATRLISRLDQKVLVMRRRLR